MAIFDNFFDEEIVKLLNGNMDFYKKMVDNDKLRSKVKQNLFDLIYYEYKKMKKQGKQETQKKKE